MATLYLLYGFVGGGKTTYAKKLEAETGVMRFTPDEWMVRLHGHNPPADKFQEYYERIDGVIWDMVAAFLSRGRDVIMDGGFWGRADRDEARAHAAASGAKAVLIHVTAPESVMRDRVLKRTAELPPGALYIDENALELFKTRFEPLGEDEPHETIQTEGGSA